MRTCFCCFCFLVFCGKHRNQLYMELPADGAAEGGAAAEPIFRGPATLRTPSLSPRIADSLRFVQIGPTP